VWIKYSAKHHPKLLVFKVNLPQPHSYHGPCWLTGVHRLRRDIKVLQTFSGADETPCLLRDVDVKRSDFEFFTAVVRNPKASKCYVTAWGLLMLQCFGKQSSGALNAGQFLLITNLTHFLMCLFHFSTCFEQPSAHHQENKLCQYIIWYIIFIIIGIQPLGRFGQRREPSQATGMALVCCILGKFLGVVCHCFSPLLDVPTFATRCLHVCLDARDPSGGRWNCGQEYCPVILPKWRLPRHLGIFYMPQIYDMGPTEGRRAEDFFALKNPTASAGFDPANLGTKGQNATPRPPKPLFWYISLWK